MVVHAHPDDELFGTGGTFLRYADDDVSTILVCATLGEEGEIHDPDLDPIESKPRLGEIRAGELRCSTEILRIGSVEMLGYRDSGMAGTPENANPASFHRADLGEATARLVRLVRQYRPQVLVSYNDFGGYGHPDHIKAHLITHAAFDRAGDPEFVPTPELPPWQPLKLYETGMLKEVVRRWRDRAREEHERRAAEAAENATGTTEPSPWSSEFFDEMERRSISIEDVTARFDVSPYRPQIVAAARCHRTQFSPDSDFFKDPPEDWEEWMGKEHFRLVRSQVKTAAPEDDLFAGVR
jgi:LmbE family N-acetylglucosaminyl deacetylase